MDVVRRGGTSLGLFYFPTRSGGMSVGDVGGHGSLLEVAFGLLEAGNVMDHGHGNCNAIEILRPMISAGYGYLEGYRALDSGLYIWYFGKGSL